MLLHPFFFSFRFWYNLHCIVCEWLKSVVYSLYLGFDMKSLLGIGLGLQIFVAPVVFAQSGDIPSCAVCIVFIHSIHI